MRTRLETEGAAAEKFIQDRLGFARHVFDNYQALIRSVDTKAGALLGLALFFAASVFPISKDAVAHVSLRTLAFALTSSVFLLSGAAFVLLFLSLMNVLGHIVKPRGARFYSNGSKTENLIWQEHIIKHSDNSSYFAAVSTVAPNVTLRNLTDQIFELAHISTEKMSAINAGFRLLRYLAFSWITNVISGLALIGWKR